jgi:hypothetical protein
LIKEEFQDVATYAFEGTKPAYVEKTPQEVVTSEGFDLSGPLDQFATAIVLEKIKMLTRRAEDFVLQKSRLYDRIMLHLSHDSVVQLQSYVELYKTIKESYNPRALWLLLQKSHTTKNSAVTEVEQRAAVKRLEDLKQVAEDGRSVPLKLYNETWNELHKQAVDIGATTLGTETDLIRRYMNSLDKTLIGAEIARKLYKPKLMPKTLASAQSWAITFTDHTEQVLGMPYDQSKRSFSQSGIANAAAPISIPEHAKRPRNDTAPKSASPQCTFCKGASHSIAECYKANAYLKEKRSEIDT